MTHLRQWILAVLGWQYQTTYNHSCCHWLKAIYTVWMTLTDVTLIDVYTADAGYSVCGKPEKHVATIQ